MAEDRRCGRSARGAFCRNCGAVWLSRRQAGKQNLLVRTGDLEARELPPIKNGAGALPGSASIGSSRPRRLQTGDIPPWRPAEQPRRARKELAMARAREKEDSVCLSRAPFYRPKLLFFL